MEQHELSEEQLQQLLELVKSRTRAEVPKTHTSSPQPYWTTSMNYPRQSVAKHVPKFQKALVRYDREVFGQRLAKKIRESVPSSNVLPFYGDAWTDGSSNVMVATSVFGLGIDHPPCSLVILFGGSLSDLDYCHESGHAGRDGAETECLLLCSLQQMHQQLTAETKAMAKANSPQSLFPPNVFAKTSKQ